MTNEEWLNRYEKQLILRGVDKKFARATRDAASENVDLAFSPEDAADDELSYMAADCELPSCYYQ
jgi:hypothetical protein